MYRQKGSPCRCRIPPVPTTVSVNHVCCCLSTTPGTTSVFSRDSKNDDRSKPNPKKKTEKTPRKNQLAGTECHQTGYVLQQSAECASAVPSSQSFRVLWFGFLFTYDPHLKDAVPQDTPTAVIALKNRYRFPSRFSILECRFELKNNIIANRRIRRSCHRKATALQALAKR